jgi:hypothetical protein
MRKSVTDFYLECMASVKRTFAGHLLLYVCLALFTGLTIAITAVYKVPLALVSTMFFLETAPQYFAVGLFLAAVAQYVLMARAGSRRPLRDFGAWLHRGALSGERPGHIFHSLMTITPLMVSFSVLKEDIPLIHPFSWDQTFSQWDRALGFGYMPWEWLQPVLGYPMVTAGIGIAYDAWFFVMFGVLFWQAFFARAGLLRMQFLLAFAFSWFIAGNMLAVFFSSAGPCYYGYFHTPDPYAAQLAYLRGVSEQWSASSVIVQDILWKSYAATKGVNIGISAMPSMHVVVATLLAILCVRTNKWLGTALTGFAAVIVVGSVHLGWHTPSMLLPASGSLLSSGAVRDSSFAGRCRSEAYHGLPPLPMRLLLPTEHLRHAYSVGDSLRAVSV